jgi:hypothetical protein
VGTTSPLAEIKQAELLIKGVLRKQDLHSLSRADQKVIAQLKQDISDARLDIRDSEYADTGEDYKRHVTTAKQRIAKVIAAILVLSQEGIFSPIEVAELSAKLEIIGSRL